MTTMVHGLRVTSLADTWVDLGEVVDRGVGRDDLVVAGDVVAGRTPGIHPRSPVTDAVQPLADALAARVRPRHKTLLMTALSLVRDGVRSPMETRARLMFHDARFPEPEVNGPVHAARRRVARRGATSCGGSSGWSGSTRAPCTRAIAARSRDAHRSGLLGDEGWTVLELFREDLVDRARRTTTLRRFARALHLDPSTLAIT